MDHKIRECLSITQFFFFNKINIMQLPKIETLPLNVRRGWLVVNH
jgi:hypothetical protein